MRSALFAVPLLLAFRSASAETSRVELADIIRDPKPFIGQQIRVVGLRCASEPNGPFVCGAQMDNTQVRIESLALDFRTSAEIRRKLSSRCRTSLASASETCRFEAEFKPVTVRTSHPAGAPSKRAVYLKVRRMDLF